MLRMDFNDCGGFFTEGGTNARSVFPIRMQGGSTIFITPPNTTVFGTPITTNFAASGPLQTTPTESRFPLQENPEVRAAFLGLVEPDLPAAVAAAVAAGASEIRILPLFFFSGRHVLEDVPRLAAEARAAHPGVRIDLLEPAGRDRALAPSRETIYLPEHDLVLIGGRVQGQGGKYLWLAYDCAKNAWQGIEFGGTDPITRGAFNNSMGLMYDPNRKLVWAVGQNSHVHVLRFDPKTATIEELR